jgi:O-6-methylguanine DNA methyltransferase
MSGTPAPRPRGGSRIREHTQAAESAGLSCHIREFGPLRLALTLDAGGALAAVRLPGAPPEGLNAGHLAQALRALDGIPVAPQDNPSRRAFQEALCQVPAGSTVSYGELAARLQTSPRAVASRCAANPVLLRIPCHRVTAKNHAGGFQAGPAWKGLLLRLESELYPRG